MNSPNSLTIQQALQKACELLQLASDTARQDATVLLAHILGKPRSWIIAHPEEGLSTEQQADFRLASRRLADRVPLPYILGHWEFYGLDFLVNENVLIPRPETELLVDVAIQWLNQHKGRRLAADVGTGSGCIAVSLAVCIPDLVIHASDVSPTALDLASRNAHQHAVQDRVIFHQGNLLAELPSSPDLICANLPYIPSEECRDLVVARHEPHLALDGGDNGLVLIRALLRDIPDPMSRGGLVLLEVGAGQAASVSAIARKSMPGAAVRIMQDLSGIDRLVVIDPGETEQPKRMRNG